MSEILETRREGRVQVLTLNRPEKRNALSLQLAQELVAAFDAANADPGIGAILITANGKAFCAGMDLSEISQVDGKHLDEIHDSLFSIVTRLTKPVVAAVNGAAIAGGTGLVANAHIAIASEDATFGLTEIRIGLWPLLVFRSVALAVGERRAVEMSLTGRIVPVAEAHAIALVHEIAADPLERASEIAQHLSQLSATSIRDGLESVYRSRGQSWQAAGEIAMQLRAQILRSPDFAEGLAAFREKRQPSWNV
jgi:enoyl-CoA hydratase/carnithine racemase